MQLTTNVRRRDFLVFRLSTHVCPGFFFWLNIAVAVLVTWMFYPGPPFSVPMLVGASVLCLSVWLFLVAFSMVIAVLEVLLIPSLRRGIVGEHRFQLTEEGLLEETSVNRTLHAWSSVDGTRQILGALMLRAGPGWHIFPRTTFCRRQARQEFLATIDSFRAQGAQSHKAT